MTGRLILAAAIALAFASPASAKIWHHHHHHHHHMMMMHHHMMGHHAMGHKMDSGASPADNSADDLNAKALDAAHSAAPAAPATPATPPPQ